MDRPAGISRIAQPAEVAEKGISFLLAQDRMDAGAKGHVQLRAAIVVHRYPARGETCKNLAVRGHRAGAANKSLALELFDEMGGDIDIRLATSPIRSSPESPITMRTSISPGKRSKSAAILIATSRNMR